jgi:WD40 repeat protein
MKRRSRNVLLSLFLLALLFQPATLLTSATPQEQKPKDDRGLGKQPATNKPAPEQTQVTGSKPEIVLQAGIVAPQTQINFSPDGRLLASEGAFGNAIKLWDVASGSLLRQLESSIPSIGASSLTRPFRFTPDGKTIIAVADGRVRRWEVDTGRELNGNLLPTARDFFAAVLSDDGRTFAALNMDSSAVRFWDTTAGRELRSITFGDEVRIAGQDAIALSPDGKLLAALVESTKASRKGIELKLEVLVWEVASGRKLQSQSVVTRPAQLGVVNEQTGSVAFSPDGSWLAMRQEDSMKIWDVATGSELKSFPTPGTLTGSDPGLLIFASKFVFSADRHVVSLVREGRKIDLLDSTSTRVLRNLAGHEGNIVGLCFSGDGKLLASSGTDNQIKLWDVATGREVRTLSGAAMPVSDIAFAPDGKSLVLAGPQAASVWELTTGGVRRAVALPKDYARTRQDGMMERSSLLSSDGKFIIAGSKSDSAVKIWEVGTGKQLSGISLTSNKELGNASFSADDRVVALSERANQTPGPAPVQSSVQAPTGVSQNPMAMPDLSKMMEQMKKDPKRMQEEMKKVQEALSKGDLSAGINMIESMGVILPTNKPSQSPNKLRLVDVTSGRELQTLPLPSGFLNQAAGNSMMSSSALSFSPDNRLLASALGFNAPVVLRDASTGQELRTLKTQFSMSVNSLAWSPDSRRLASAHWGMGRNLIDPAAGDSFSFDDLKFSLKVWDTQTGNELNSFEGHNNFVNTLAFSSDKRLLASAGYDNTIKLWDLTTGAELRTLRGHSGSITTVKFSPDGQFVVSGSDDGSARLWKTQTGELQATLVVLNKGADWLVVTPDGLFDGSPGGWSQILWRFTPGIFEVSPVEMFFNEYFHPGLLPDLLAGQRLSASVDISRKDRRQPKLRLTTADAQTALTAVSTPTLKLRVDVTEAPAGAQDVRLFRNGSLVKVWRGEVLLGRPTTQLETTVRLIAGQNKFTAYAFNRENVKSTDATLLLTGAETLRRPASLHLLVIGVNQYANVAYNLKYAVADAQDFGEEFERQQRKIGQYEEIEVTTLLDSQATKANVLYALKRLAGSADGTPPAGSPAELQKIKTAEPEDLVVIYYAGHGTAQDQRFYLIPHDLGYEGSRTELDDAGLRTILLHSISDLELEQACESVDAGLIVMLIDACNSGQALEAEEKRRGPMNSKGLAQLAYEKGMYILTAAQSYQAALEAEQLGHGYLTFALVEEGLKTPAADFQPPDNQVMLREWLDYATERVPRMQEMKLRAARDLKLNIAFVEGEERVADFDKRSLQRPRVFYRRELEAQPLVVAKP